jgi:hypothetical protein
MRWIAVIAAGALMGCGAAPDTGAELDENGEQSQPLLTGDWCVAWDRTQTVPLDHFTDCVTRGGSTATQFTLTNFGPSTKSVLLHSGTDYRVLSLPGGLATFWSHQYFGGVVRIVPLDGSIGVRLR